MPLFNSLKIDDEERELGTNDPLNIRGGLEATGEFIGDQYQKLPENVRGTLSDITGALATGARQGIEMHKDDPFTTFDALGAAYKPIQLIKDEASRKTGLDPINFDAAELAVDLATPIPFGKAKAMLDEVFEYGAKNIPARKVYAATDNIPKPAPQPDWVDAAKVGKLADEKIVMQNALADELVFDATGKHISKRKEDAYKFLGKFRAEWNRWSKDNKYIQEFADKPSTAYVEHLVGKDRYYDPFWALPNEKRFRKGSRHGPHNVRILYNNRMKSFKDASETILKKIHKPKDPMDFILLDYDIPIPEPGSIAVQQAPGNLLVKRVDGTIIGELGDYHDILYASNSEKYVGKYKTLSYKLGSHINPRTGKPYIKLTKEITDKNGKKVTVKLSKDEINQQITNWREKILKDKLQLIINEEKTLKGMDEATRFQRQGKAIQKDMEEFLHEYSFIEPTKGFRRELKKEPFQSARGGKPIKTEKDKREGIFLTKRDELKLHKAYLKKGSVEKELLDNIIEPD